MILGLSLSAFTTLHTVISLIAIATGIVALIDMLRGRYGAALTAVFLTATIATSATGFLFPNKAIGPPHIVGAVSLVLLAVAVFALYGAKLMGRWRAAYVGTAVASLWLNVFVLVAQGFAKVPALKAMAPTGTEPPFGVAQAVVLLVFVGLGWKAVKGFRAPA